MTVEEYHSAVRFFSREYMVHPGCDSSRKSGLLCLLRSTWKGIRWQPNISLHFLGKASAGAPDTRDGEALPEKMQKKK